MGLSLRDVQNRIPWWKMIYIYIYIYIFIYIISYKRWLNPLKQHSGERQSQAPRKIELWASTQCLIQKGSADSLGRNNLEYMNTSCVREGFHFPGISWAFIISCIPACPTYQSKTVLCLAHNLKAGSSSDDSDDEDPPMELPHWLAQSQDLHPGKLCANG